MEARVLLGDPGSEPYAVRTIARPGASLDDLGERAVSMEPEVAGAAERARELGAHRVERGVVEEEHRPRLGRVPPVLHREQAARIAPHDLRQLKHHHVCMGGGSIQLARVFGIRVGVSPSWFFILFLMIYSLSGYFDSVLSGSRNTAYAVAVAGAILFFASIVLHELGHAMVARRHGIGIAGIDLWFFGGIAKMEREAETPGEDFKVAAAGPAVTLLIAGASLAGAAALSETGGFFDVATLNADVNASPGLALLGWLFLINAVLFAFNLIPAFPLDGGRIARAIAWKVTGDRNRATQLSGRIGQAFGYGLIGLGIFLASQGDTINGIWFALIGVFLGQAARGAVVSSQVSERIEGVTVADLMDTDPFTPAKETPALEAQESLSRHGVVFAPIVDEARRYLGYVRAERIDGAVAAGQPILPVGELADQEDASLPPDAPLGTLLGAPALAGMGAIAVVEPGGRLAGVVTMARVRQAIAAVASQRPL